jgi:hypothetical protein
VIVDFLKVGSVPYMQHEMLMKRFGVESDRNCNKFNRSSQKTNPEPDPRNFQMKTLWFPRE